MIKSFFKFTKTVAPQYKIALPKYQSLYAAPTMYRFSSDAGIDKILLEEVEIKVFEVLKSAAKCKTDKLTRTASFEELGFDSLDSVEMVVALEENFGVDLEESEAEKLSNVNDAIQLFYKHKLEQKNNATSQ